MEIVTTIHTQDGELLTLKREQRKVFTSTKGRYIVTRGHGRVYLDDNNVGAITYMHMRGPRSGLRINKRIK